ncbi:hypothetical protein U1Q18_015220 [Sarracenia purpurea var. burkii]
MSLSEPDPNLRVDDVIPFVTFPLSIILVIDALRGSTENTLRKESDSVMDVEAKLYESLLKKSNISGFPKALIISKAFWLGMNPLPSKGYKPPLKTDGYPDPFTWTQYRKNV